MLISLEWEAEPHILGRQKKYARGSRFTGKVWVNNDHFHDIEKGTDPLEIHRGTEMYCCRKTFYSDLEEDSATVKDTISWIIPEDYVGNYVVDMFVKR